MARTPDQSRPITPPIGPASEYDGPKRPSVATVVQTEHPLGSRWRKRSPRKSREETGPENAALSAPPGRLVLHPTPAKPRKLGRKPGLVSSLSRLGSLLGGGGSPERTGLGPSGSRRPAHTEPAVPLCVHRALAANRGAHAEAAQRPDLGACRRRRAGARAPFHRQGRGRRDVGGLSGSGYLRRCLGGRPRPRDGRQASPSAVEASYLGITGSSTYEAMSSWW